LPPAGFHAMSPAVLHDTRTRGRPAKRPCEPRITTAGSPPAITGAQHVAG
jgi:hypothetical protein